jgi:hypothetical protein
VRIGWGCFGSQRAGKHRCVQSNSFVRMCPDRSRSCTRCMMTINTPLSWSLRRDGIELVPESKRFFSCDIARAANSADVVRIIENDDIAALAGDHAALRESVAACKIIEAGLLILIGAQSNAMSPKVLIRRRGNDLPTFHAMSGRELAVIGQVHELHAGTTPAILPYPKGV